MTNYERVFVYGTLKKGEPNHYILETKNFGNSKFIGVARTVEKYPLIIGTQYNIPFLLDKPGTGHNVEGEIYEVDSAMLCRLDELEDHPNYYVRRKELVSLETGQEQCWTYFILKFPDQLLSKQMLSCYTANASHNLKYCENHAKSCLDDLLEQ